MWGKACLRIARETRSILKLRLQAVSPQMVLPRHCLYAKKKVLTFFHWVAPPPRPPGTFDEGKLTANDSTQPTGFVAYNIVEMNQ